MKRFLTGAMTALFALSLAAPAFALGEQKWFVSVEDENGKPVTSANVIVYTAGTATQATIYSNDEGTTKTNDFAVDTASGVGEFYLPVSTTSVDVLIYSGSRSVKINSASNTTHRVILPSFEAARQRSVALPLAAFCSDTGAACIPLTDATTPSIEENVSSNIPAIKWDDNETTAAAINVRVPLDYLGNGQLRLMVSSEGLAGGHAYYDYETYVSTVNGSTALDAAVTNPAAAQIASGGSGSPVEVTLTPADWSALTAGQLVTVRVFRDDTVISDLYLWNAEFVYTAKQ